MNTEGKLVSIIIVNWNGEDDLRKCLPSVFRQNYKNIEVILVDNASSDSSVDYARKKFLQTKLIINKKNLGFAEANNIGYRKAKGEFILFLNNDTIVTKNFLTKLVGVLEADKSIGGAQSKISQMDNRKFLDAVGSFLTPSGFLYHYGFARRDADKYRRKIDIYSAKGAAMIFKRDVLEKIKVRGDIFDRRYFAYFEETDLCHRIWLAGYTIVFVPNSRIYHKIGATSRRLDDFLIHYHSFKNRINSYIKNFGPGNIVRILFFHLMLCIIAALLYSLRGKPKMSMAILSAIFWNIKNLNRTIKDRHYIQNYIRAVSDEKLFLKIMKPTRPNYYYYLFLGHLKDYED